MALSILRSFMQVQGPFLLQQSHSSSGEEEEISAVRKAGAIVALVEAVLFYALFLFGLVMTIILLVKERKRSWSIRKGVFPLLLVPIFFRGLEISLSYKGYFNGPLQNQTPLEMFLGCIPNYTYFFSYSLMFSFWIGKQNKTKQNKFIFTFIYILFL